MKEIFFHQNEAYAEQREDGSYLVVRQPIKDIDIQLHLYGKKTLGCYPIRDNTCKLAAIDIDIDGPVNKDTMDLVYRDILQLTEFLISLSVYREQIYIELSGSKGAHLWMFFDEPMPSDAVYYFLRKVAEIPTAGKVIRRETFPKQATLQEDQVGNLIKVPFGIHRRTKKSTYLVDHTGTILDPENLKLNKISAGQFHDICRRLGIRTTATITPDLELLLSRCQFIRGWCANPDGIGYDAWMGIGSNLCKLGSEGIQCWEDLSRRDTRGWDEDVYHKKLAELSKLRPYSCKRLGCERQCGVGRPIGHIEGRPIIQTRVDEQPNTVVPIQVFRDHFRAQIKDVIKECPSAVILVRGFPGVGKTYEFAHQLKDSGDSVAWSAPNHNQANQVLDIFRSDAVHLKSREYMDKSGEFRCPHVGEIKKAYEAGLPVKAMYCFDKDKRCYGEKCPYLRKYKVAEQADVVVLMHDHLQTETVAHLEKDWLVIDENPAAYLRKTVKFTTSDIKFSLRVARHIKNEELRRNLRNALVQLMRDGTIPDVRVEPTQEEESQFHSDVIYGYTKVEKRGDNVRWLHDDITYIKNYGTRVVHRGQQYVYSRESWLPGDRPVVILDATQTVEGLKLLLPGREIREISLPGYEPEQVSEVIHVIGGTYHATTMFNKAASKLKTSGERVLDAIEREVGLDSSIITHKSLVEIAQLEGKHPRCGWYGALRGLNDFKDDEKVVILGFWMRPLRVIVEKALEQHGIIDVDVEEEIRRARKDLETRYTTELVTLYGQRYHGRTFRFSNPYVQNYFNYDIMAELTQALGRARIHCPIGARQQVWIFTDVLPDFVRATRVVNMGDLVEDPRIAGSVEKIMLALDHAENPESPKSIHKACQALGVHIGIATINRHYKEALDRWRSDRPVLAPVHIRSELSAVAPVRLINSTSITSSIDNIYRGYDTVPCSITPGSVSPISTNTRLPVVSACGTYTMSRVAHVQIPAGLIASGTL